MRHFSSKSNQNVWVSQNSDQQDFRKPEHSDHFRRKSTVLWAICVPKLSECEGFLKFCPAKPKKRRVFQKTIEKNYRTAPDKRTYFGYSAGGLFGAYILMAQPDTFKNYIIGSPSLWGDIPTLAEIDANSAAKRKGLNANVFISYGTLEKELGKHVEEFITLLKNKDDKSLSLKHVVIEGEHGTAFPLTGVRGVTWLSTLINATK